MKTITLSVALFLSAMVSTFATNVEANTAVIKVNTTDKKNDGPKVYQWYVKTVNGVYSGTASSLEQANRMISNTAGNGRIISKDVRSIALNQKVNIEKIYTWGVSTNYGFASGTSGSYSEAQKMVSLMRKGDIMESEIIESYKIVK